MRISDWSSDVCSSDLVDVLLAGIVVVTAERRAKQIVQHASGDQRAEHGSDLRVASEFQQCAVALHGGIEEHECGVQYRGPLALFVEIHADLFREKRGFLARLAGAPRVGVHRKRSEEHTSELQSLMRISYAVFCLKKQKHYITQQPTSHSDINITICTYN